MKKMCLVGTPCPVPNCEGFVKFDEDGGITCDYGHTLQFEESE